MAGEILNILEFLMNLQKMKTAEATRGGSLLMELAQRSGGDLGATAAQYPKLGQQFERAVGGLPKTPVMKPATPTEEQMDIGSTRPVMTQTQPSAFARMMGAKPQEVPMMQTQWPKLGLTPSEEYAKGHLGLAQEAAKRSEAAGKTSLFSHFVMPLPEGGHRNLTPQEIEQANQGRMPQEAVPRPPQSTAIEQAHEANRIQVTNALAGSGNDPEKIIAIYGEKEGNKLLALGQQYKLIQKVGDKWKLGEWKEETKYVPTFKTQVEAVKAGKPFAPPGQYTIPHAVQGGYTFGYERPLEIDKPLEEGHVKGIQTAAISEYLPLVQDRIKAEYKDLAEVRRIIAAMSRDPYTGQVNIYELYPYLTVEERQGLTNRLISSADIMKAKKVSSFDAWEQSKKAISKRPEEPQLAPGHGAGAGAAKKTKADRVAELVAAGKTDNEIKAQLKKEGY